MMLSRLRRQQRRFFHQEFNETAVKRFFPAQLAAAHILLRRLVHSPDDYMEHIKSMAATVILSVAYGLEIQPRDDPLVKLNDEALNSVLDAARPGKYLVVSLMHCCLCSQTYSRQGHP